MLFTLLMIGLLMSFCIVLWKLGNPTLAAIAGTGACTLAADSIRRWLGIGGDGGFGRAPRPSAPKSDSDQADRVDEAGDGGNAAASDSDR